MIEEAEQKVEQLDSDIEQKKIWLGIPRRVQYPDVEENKPQPSYGKNLSHMCSKIGSCPVCKLTLLAIKHKDVYGTPQNRRDLAEGQLRVIDSMLKKRERANKSHLASHAKVTLEIGTTQMWNTKKSPREAPVTHFHNRDMYLAYAEMLRIEKNEKLMRSSNVFMRNWGQLEANVPIRSPLDRYELPPLKQKKA